MKEAIYRGDEEIWWKCPDCGWLEFARHGTPKSCSKCDRKWGLDGWVVEWVKEHAAVVVWER